MLEYWEDFTGYPCRDLAAFALRTCRLAYRRTLRLYVMGLESNPRLGGNRLTSRYKIGAVGRRSTLQCSGTIQRTFPSDVCSFVATSSFFLRQQQVFPRALRGSVLLLILGVFPLFVLLFWFIRLRFTRYASRLYAPASLPRAASPSVAPVPTR